MGREQGADLTTAAPAAAAARAPSAGRQRRRQRRQPRALLLVPGLLSAAALLLVARAQDDDPATTARLGYDPATARQDHGAYIGCFDGTQLWQAGVLEWVQQPLGGGSAAAAAAAAPAPAPPWPLGPAAGARCPVACRQAGFPLYAVSRGLECACLGQAPAGGARLPDAACDAAPAPAPGSPPAAAPAKTNATAGALVPAAAAPSVAASSAAAGASALERAAAADAVARSRSTVALFYLHDADAARVALITPDMPGGGADATTGAACRLVDVPMLPPGAPLLPAAGRAAAATAAAAAGRGASSPANATVAAADDNDGPASASAATGSMSPAYNPSNVLWGGEPGAMAQLARSRFRPASPAGRSTAASLAMDAGQGTRLEETGGAVAYGMHSFRARVAPEAGVITTWYLRSDERATAGDFDEVR